MGILRTLNSILQRLIPIDAHAQKYIDLTGYTWHGDVTFLSLRCANSELQMLTFICLRTNHADTLKIRTLWNSCQFIRNRCGSSFIYALHWAPATFITAQRSAAAATDVIGCYHLVIYDLSWELFSGRNRLPTTLLTVLTNCCMRAQNDRFTLCLMFLYYIQRRVSCVAVMVGFDVCIDRTTATFWASM